MIIQEMLQDFLTCASEAAGSLIRPQQLLEASKSSEQALKLLRTWDGLVARVHEALWESKVQRMDALSAISC